MIVVAKVGHSRAAASSPKTSKGQREEFLRKLRDSAPEALKRMWEESRRNGTDKITMREINAEVAAHRREKRHEREATTIRVR